MKGEHISRRDFVKAGAAVVVAGAAIGTAGAQEASQLKKALQFGMLPKDLTDADKFKLARKCGFEGIEMNPVEDLARAKALGEMARGEGVPVHSVVYGGWEFPLSDPNPEVVEKGLKAAEQAMRAAKVMGADAVLLVPGRVNAKVRYVECYERTQKAIPRLFPVADELALNIAVEFVWNDFLLSPLEFARYIDELNHPRLKAYFDTGNVVAYGWPEDWIRTLGKRIVKIHLKDFKRKEREWVNLRDGDVNWPEVRKALAEIGYAGFLTPELGPGDEAYLKDLSERIDLIIAGK